MNRTEEILQRLYDIMGLKKDFEFCEKYEIKANTLSTWKKRNKIPYELIEEISQNENISLDLILKGEGSYINENSQSITGNGNTQINGSNKISNYNKKNDDIDRVKKPEKSKLIKIPYFSDTYASAGAGALNYNDKPKPMAFDYDFLSSILGVTSFKNLHLINSIGNSMEPTIMEGELLFVNPFENEFNQIKDGGIYVINCNNSVFVKRINHNPITGAVVLISDNVRVPDIEINGQEFENCTIIGRVVGHFASF